MTPAEQSTADLKGDKKGVGSVPVATDLPSQLKWYYSRLFPVELFGRWLSYGDNDYLNRREVSFTLPGDIYLRFRSFATISGFHDALKSQTPIKIDIGAVYNFAPRDRNTVSAALTPVQKELVFDIDMTDYADVLPESDLSLAENCDKQWQYMATAVRVLDTALREDFGFKHVLWVYSGRRGIHCWVCDARARALDNSQRSSIAEYLQIRFEGREHAGRRQNEVTVPMHPSLSRAKHICDVRFQQDVLDTREMLKGTNAAEILCDIGNEHARRACMDKLDDSKSSRENWTRVEREVSKAARHDYALRGVCEYIEFKYTYPRLDVNVSKEINHLLKAPFCVHPKTGRVCIPFSAQEAHSFEPGLHAPVVSKLVAEIEREGDESRKLTHAVNVFEQFVKGVEDEARGVHRKQLLDRLDERGAMMTISNQ